MKLREYFGDTAGTGVLSATDGAGKVEAAERLQIADHYLAVYPDMRGL